MVYSFAVAMINYECFTIIWKEVSLYVYTTMSAQPLTSQECFPAVIDSIGLTNRPRSFSDGYRALDTKEPRDSSDQNDGMCHELLKLPRSLRVLERNKPSSYCIVEYLYGPYYTERKKCLS